jgi:hypothetical protein
MTTFKTGNPVPSSAAKDLYDNAENLDAAVNGAAARWVDRTGRVRMSISGTLDALEATMDEVREDAQIVLESLGYLVPVPYAAGLSVGSARFTVAYGGDTYAANADAVPFVTGATFDATKWRLVQGVTAGVLGSPSGSGLVGYSAPGSGGVLVDVGFMLDRVVTADNYRLSSDADDLPSFQRMHDALGFIRLAKKTYFCRNGLNMVDEDIRIYGAGRPFASSAGDWLVDGSGSIIVGTLQLRASNFDLMDFGADVGNSRAFDENQEGIVADAREGTSGNFARIRNVASMGPTSATTSHALLVEGFDRFEIDEVAEFNHNYGVVVKSRNGFIRNITSTDIKTAAVYPKASLPGVAGNVLSGRVDNIQISGVKSSGTGPMAMAVWVHAEGVAASRVTISDVTHTGGRCGIRVSADAGQYVSDVKVSELSVDGALLGWELFGDNYEVKVKNATVTNPGAGEMFQTDALSRGWNFTGMSLVVTETESIAGTSVARMLGTGTWDDLNVRNDARNMAISHDMDNVRGGKKRGAVLYFGEGSLVPALKDGFAPAPGEMPPYIAVGADNTLHMKGAVTGVSSTGWEILELMGTLSFGLNRRFSVAGMKTDNTYAPVTVVASGAKLTLESPLDRSTLSKIDLSGVVVRR